MRRSRSSTPVAGRVRVREARSRLSLFAKGLRDAVGNRGKLRCWSVCRVFAHDLRNFDSEKMRLKPAAGLAVRLRAWERYASGRYTLATLAHEFSLEGVTIRGRTLTRFSVYEILSSDVDLQYGGLAPETHTRAREILASHRLAVAKTGQRRHTYLFADLVRCATCGERYIGRAFWRPGKAEPELQLKHAPRGCRHGIRSEAALNERIARWLDSWRLPANARARVARFVAKRAAVDPNVERRKQLEGAVERLRKQHEWGVIADSAFLAEHTTLNRALVELGPAAIVPPPSADALKMAERIGQAWRKVSDETRRRFLSEWFSELRLSRDGGVTMVPREPYRAIVYAAVGTVGDAGFEPATSAM